MTSCNSNELCRFSFHAASQDKFCLAIGQGITSNMAAEKHVGNR